MNETRWYISKFFLNLGIWLLFAMCIFFFISFIVLKIIGEIDVRKSKRDLNLICNYEEYQQKVQEYEKAKILLQKTNKFLIGSVPFIVLLYWYLNYFN